MTKQPGEKAPASDGPVLLGLLLGLKATLAQFHEEALRTEHDPQEAPALLADHRILDAALGALALEKQLNRWLRLLAAEGESQLPPGEPADSPDASPSPSATGSLLR